VLVLVLVVGQTSEAAPARRTSLTTQAVLNQIHSAVHSYDSTQNDLPDVGGIGPRPRHKTKHYIRPISAFLQPSAGGFKTDCRDGYVITYRSFKITTLGTTFQTCGPFNAPEQKAKPAEFQAALDRIGRMILKAAQVRASPEVTRSIAGTRKSVTARYTCPSAGGGVTQIVLKQGRKSTRATVTPC
jgi:hypothetical protein